MTRQNKATLNYPLTTRPSSVLREGIEKTLRLNIPLPNPETLTPEEALHYRTQVAQYWIQEDIRRGVLPGDIGGFIELHDYVDGNAYLFDECLGIHRIACFFNWESWSTPRIMAHINAMGEALDAWLKNSRKGEAVDYLKYPQ